MKQFFDFISNNFIEVIILLFVLLYCVNSVCKLPGDNQVALEQEKTKQLELQLKLETLKKTEKPLVEKP